MKNVLCGIFVALAAYAPPAAAQSLGGTPIPDAASLAAWGETIAETALPHDGCFTVSYPNTLWQEVSCAPTPENQYPLIPNPPLVQIIPTVVGNGTDFVSQESGATKTYQVQGSLAVTGVTSGTDSQFGLNSYTLQINSKPFDVSSKFPSCIYPSCSGWQQFVFANTPLSNNYQGIFMQYWLLNYGPCPLTWTPHSGSCYKNSSSTSFTFHSIADLSRLKLVGTTHGGTLTNQDSVIIYYTPPVGGTVTASAMGANSVLGLRTGWDGAEFNVFGYGNLSQLNFSPSNGSTIVVSMEVKDGTTTKPTIVNTGFTGETNNLTLVSPACSHLDGNGEPDILFTESNASGAQPPTCN